MKQEELLNQHLKIYLNSLEELINNNTYSLINDDLLPLFTKPPLEAMDIIKQKLLSLGKDYKLILNTQEVDNYIERYRFSMQKKVKTLEDLRKKYLKQHVESLSQKSKDGTLKLLRKNLLILDKNLKKEIKIELIENMNFLIENISNFYQTDKIPDRLLKYITKYLKTTYPKDLMETIDMKIIVKNTTLINGINEQTERLIFTQKNSHLFD
ncbi:MAG: hypothetical protein PUB03_00605 [bacterium]|nr:hypothetical protein [bacterium]